MCNSQLKISIRCHFTHYPDEVSLSLSCVFILFSFLSVLLDVQSMITVEVLSSNVQSTEWLLTFLEIWK